MRAKVRGLGLSRVEFKCEKIAAEIRPGRRIVITRAQIIDEDESDGDEVEHKLVEAPATIIRTMACGAKPLSFCCVVDPGETEDKYRWRKVLPHHRIVRFLEEPDKRICSCGNVIWGSEAEGWVTDYGLIRTGCCRDRGIASKAAEALGAKMCGSDSSAVGW